MLRDGSVEKIHKGFAKPAVRAARHAVHFPKWTCRFCKAFFAFMGTGMSLQLRDYQERCVASIAEYKSKGVLRQLVVAATGTGKSVIFSHLVSQEPGRSLVLTHRDALVEQAATHLERDLLGQTIGSINGRLKQYGARVSVGSVPTLCRDKNLAKTSQYDLVIVDECHLAQSKTFRKVIDHVCHENTLLVGFTATPNRADGKGLAGVFDEIVFEYPLIQATNEGWLAPLKTYEIALDCDMSGLKMKTEQGERDVNLDDLQNVMEASRWCEHVAGEWQKLASDRLTLAFTPRVKMAYDLADQLCGMGYRAAAMDGSTDRGHQKRMKEQFKRGEIQVLASCDLLNIGVDLPPTNAILMARPTKSFTVFSQAIGRGTRLSPGKTNCLLLYVKGIGDFDFQTPASLIGTKEVKDGETLTEAAERDEEEKEAVRQMEIRLLDGRAVTIETDLLGRTKTSKGFQWQIDTVSKWARLRTSAEHFWIHKRDGVYEYGARTDATFGAVVATYPEAREACEARAKELIFGDKNAPWRQKLASDNQVKLLLKHNLIPFDTAESITKGEASDLLVPLFERWNKAKGKAA